MLQNERPKASNVPDNVGIASAKTKKLGLYLSSPQAANLTVSSDQGAAQADATKYPNHKLSRDDSNFDFEILDQKLVQMGILNIRRA